MADSRYLVYILECKDTTLYTGVTNDLQKRLERHRQGKGAKYTRGRSPLKLVWVEEQPNRSAALRREREIKALSRDQKRELIASSYTEGHEMQNDVTRWRARGRGGSEDGQAKKL